MSVKMLGALIVIAVIAIAAYGIWFNATYPRVIVSTGSVTVTDPKKINPDMILRTRVVRQGNVTTSETELPGGTWIDCTGDCDQAVREATYEFWETHQRQGR